MNIADLFKILKDGESEKVEFKEAISREIKKAVCAFANTSGGQVFIGVKDDGSPIGVKSSKWKDEISDILQSLFPMPNFLIKEVLLSNLRIIVIEVKESSQLVSSNHIAYIRAGSNNHPLSIDEVITKSAESLRVFFDQITSDVSITEFDKNAFNDYLSVREKIRGIKPLLVHNALLLHALTEKNGKLRLTNAGVLCFSANPEQHIISSSVKVVRFMDSTMQAYDYQKEFTGPLQNIVYDLEEFFIKNLRLIGGEIIGFKRRAFLEYPLSALREAIINAIIHRNYFDPAEIRIFIFPDRIEIKNPGAFPPGVTVENPEHKPRNPILAQFFYDLGLTEKYGSGIIKILKETKEHPLVKVDFVTKPYSTTVIFTKKQIQTNLDETSKQILEILTLTSSSSGEIAKHVKLSRQAIVKRMKDLAALGLVLQKGSGSETVYELNLGNK